MSTTPFYALQEELAPLTEGGKTRPVRLHLLELGQLELSSGLLGLADPLAGELTAPLTASLPSGAYRVVATVADVSPAQDASHFRTAYLSLVPLERPRNGAGFPEEPFGFIPVDAGVVGLFDAEEVKQGLEALTPAALDALADGWITLLETSDELPEDYARAELATDRGTTSVFMAAAGWGDGYYPALRTMTPDGKLAGVHIDLQVIGEAEELLQPLEEASEVAPSTTAIPTIVFPPEPPSSQEEDITKLKKTVKEYEGMWPAFLTIGFTFFILGLQTFAFFPVGMVFIVLSIVWCQEGKEAREKLQKLGIELPKSTYGFEPRKPKKKP